VRLALAALLLLLLPSAAVPAVRSEFRAQLDPVAFDRVSRDSVAGSGSVTATLAGNTLTVTGSFSGLPSSASSAQLRMGLAMGVPGPAIGTLSAEAGSSGRLSGELKLTAAQITALRASALYVQLASVGAPEGHLWGWLEAH
jgi:CHRD domain